METVGLSALVIARNEEAGIARCLTALAFCDEIVLVDAESADATVEIARRFTDRVWIEPWRGYSAQKTFALERCRGDWVLWIDADEVVSAELAHAIQQAVAASREDDRSRPVAASREDDRSRPVAASHEDDRSGPVAASREDDRSRPVAASHEDDRSRPAAGNPSVDAYEVNRRVHYLGAWIRHSGWGEDRVVRLFRRGRARFSDDQVHERLLVNGPVGRLPGVLEHYTYRDLAHHWEKIRGLAILWAEQAYSRGRRAGTLDLVFRPVARALKLYVVRRGYLDGWRGWVIAGMGGAYVFLKYSMLKEREEQER